MKISTSLISTSNYSLIGNQTEVLLMIVFMHYNGKISHEKMMGMLRGLRLNFNNPMGLGFDYFSNYKPKKNVTPLLRMVRTYHCSINGRWYNYEGMYTILQEVFFQLKVEKTSMDLNEFMKYLRIFLMTSKRNKLMFFIENEIIEPVYNIFEHNFVIGQRLFNDMGLTGTHSSYPDYYRFEPSGYCCDDCDGDYETYKKYQFQSYVIDRLLKDIKESVKEILK